MPKHLASSTASFPYPLPNDLVFSINTQSGCVKLKVIECFKRPWCQIVVKFSSRGVCVKKDGSEVSRVRNASEGIIHNLEQSCLLAL